MAQKPKAGDLAVCSAGTLGLITQDEPQHVVYKKCAACIGAISGADDDCTCETGEAFVGIHLTNNNVAPIGSPWSSRNPQIVGHIGGVIQSPGAGSARDHNLVIRISESACSANDIEFERLW